jgi:Niemann-Pick C1 protein
LLQSICVNKDTLLQVDELTADYGGADVRLTDVCFKPMGEACATQSVLQYWKMDRYNLDMYGGVEHAEFCFEVGPKKVYQIQ